MLDPYPPRREIESQGQACRDVLEQGSWQDLGFPKSIFWMKRPAGGPTASGQGVSSAMVGTTPASVVQPVPCGSQSCPVWREVLSTQDSVPSEGSGHPQSLSEPLPQAALVNSSRSAGHGAEAGAPRQIYGWRTAMRPWPGGARRVINGPSSSTSGLQTWSIP